MANLTKLIITTLIGLLLVSCNFDLNFGVKGNGHVTTEERHLNENFNEIEISKGLDVYLTQSDDQHITVEADENLHEIIVTEVENNILKIYTKENISFSDAQIVKVNFKNVSKITAQSGSDVHGTNTFNTESLSLSTTSGSDMELTINVTNLECYTSSGSDLIISGTTNTLIAEASSGSDLQAKNLQTQTARVKASSGSDITVNTSKELYAHSSSGGDITYLGNPEKVEKSDNVSGSINHH